MPIQLQQIKNVKGQWRAFAIKLCPLQKLKRGTTFFVHRDNFTIDDAFIRIEIPGRACDVRESIV